MLGFSIASNGSNGNFTTNIKSVLSTIDYCASPEQIRELFEVEFLTSRELQAWPEILGN
jgi:hypothetical protein